MLSEVLLAAAEVAVAEVLEVVVAPVAVRPVDLCLADLLAWLAAVLQEGRFNPLLRLPPVRDQEHQVALAAEYMLRPLLKKDTPGSCDRSKGNGIPDRECGHQRHLPH